MATGSLDPLPLKTCRDVGPGVDGARNVSDSTQASQAPAMGGSTHGSPKQMARRSGSRSSPAHGPQGGHCASKRHSSQSVHSVRTTEVTCAGVPPTTTWVSCREVKGPPVTDTSVFAVTVSDERSARRAQAPMTRLEDCAQEIVAKARAVAAHRTVRTIRAPRSCLECPLGRLPSPWLREGFPRGRGSWCPRK